MRRLPPRFLLLTSLAVLTAGAGVLLWHLRERRADYYTDGQALRRPAGAAELRDVLWESPVRLGAAVNSDGNEYEPRPDATGFTLFFVRGKAGDNADIVFSTRTHEGWSAPEPLELVNTLADELGPEPSADGTALYFYSNRAGGLGGYDLWMARRGARGWLPAVNLGPGVNSPFHEYGPALTPDSSEIYFSSNRPQDIDPDGPDAGAWSATVREKIYRRHYDLYRAPIMESVAGAAVALDGLNTDHNDGAPAVSPAGDFLYFGSDRPGGHGGFDLYRARRTAEGIGVPQNLGAAVNSDANEMDPGLGASGFRLYFSSNREEPTPDTARADDAPPADYDLYRATSREVFMETERWRASIDWAFILPVLLWLLVVLLLIWLLWTLMHMAGSPRFRRLSLIARCLIASCLVHALIMVLLGFWGVGSSLTQWIRQGSAMQVAIVSPSVGAGVTAQVRGALTEFEIETPREEIARRQDVEPAPAFPLASPARIEVERVEMEAREQPREADAADEAPSAEVPLPDEVAEPEAETAVTVELPAVVAAAAQAEAEASAPAARAIETARAEEIPVPATAPETEVALAPAPTPAPAPAMNAANEGTEALPPIDALLVSPLPVEAEPAPGWTAPDLPLVPEVPMERVVEDAPRVVAPIAGEMPRYAAAAGAPEAAVPDREVVLAPAASSPGAVDVSLAGASADGAEATLPARVDPAPASDPVEARMTALDLDALPQQTADRAAEDRATVTTAVAPAEPNRDQAQPAAPARTELQVEIAAAQAAPGDAPRRIVDARAEEAAPGAVTAPPLTPEITSGLRPPAEIDVSLPYAAADSAPPYEADVEIAVAATYSAPSREEAIAFPLDPGPRPRVTTSAPSARDLPPEPLVDARPEDAVIGGPAAPDRARDAEFDLDRAAAVTVALPREGQEVPAPRDEVNVAIAAAAPAEARRRRHESVPAETLDRSAVEFEPVALPGVVPERLALDAAHEAIAADAAPALAPPVLAATTNPVLPGLDLPGPPGAALLVPTEARAEAEPDRTSDLPAPEHEAIDRARTRVAFAPADAAARAATVPVPASDLAPPRLPAPNRLPPFPPLAPGERGRRSCCRILPEAA